MKSATETCVAKVLVVIDDPMQVLDISALRDEQSGPESEVAICLVDGGSTTSHLTLQQQTTAQLRARFGSAAEAVAIFVVSGRVGDGVAECATDWGATEIVDLDGAPWRTRRTN